MSLNIQSFYLFEGNATDQQALLCGLVLVVAYSLKTTDLWDYKNKQVE